MEKVFDAPKKERFEFVFSINGNIICQRYFRINNYQDKAAGSVYLTEAMLDCKKIIDNDLKEKSQIYLSLTAPQVFRNREEMEGWVRNQPFKLDVPTYVILLEDPQVFVWNGTEMLPYDKPFNRADYLTQDDNAAVPSILKFAFLDDGVEVRSVSWNGNVYPRFVRTNIDISNSRNKYKTEDNFQPFEAAIVDAFNKERADLIPLLMRTLQFACNSENRRYFSRVKYGSKEYDFDIKGYNERLFLTLKRKDTD